MLFNSLEFLIFFPLVTGVYFLLPHRFRWFWLLLASCYFYMAFVPVYILILGFTIVIDYFAGIWIASQTDQRKKKLALLASLAANIGVLAFFKYWNFLNENLTELLGLFSAKNPVPFLKILLPIGLSFHTFQAMSYTIEVYRGRQKPERHLGIYALYVMFYPQLVAGPIERPQNMLHQFYEKHYFEYQRVVEGLRLMLWGMFKKVVIADRLAVYVNEVYDHPDQYHGLPVLTATYFFAIQIYCDFSGYSDIALGSAKVMGFNLMQNFNLPYFSKSIREFWSRWHISLSTWFRDYVYIPLGGNRVKEWRWLMNLLIVFMISGLWHGAKWTFIIWGALHGIYLIGEILLNKIGFVARAGKTKLGEAFRWLLTFHLVVLAWIFFRAKSVDDAFEIIRNLFHVSFSNPGINIDLGYGGVMRNSAELWISFALLLMLVLTGAIERKRGMMQSLRQLPKPGRWALYYVCVMLIILIGNFSNKTEFIYFQF
jgi:alginate O-acetyltransferase complex protein AlgI